MSEKLGESLVQETWKSFHSFNALSNPRLDEVSDAFGHFVATVTKWNEELLSFGARRAAEYAKLPERLMNCKGPPDVVALELDYLDVMRRQYAEELPRLLSLGDDVVKHGAMAWGAGNGQSANGRDQPVKVEVRSGRAQSSQRKETTVRADVQSPPEPSKVE